VQISPANFKTVYPADSPPPPVTPGAEIVKVSFPSSPPAYNAPNIPHWNLFEGAKSDATGYRALQDHLFANPIYGYADPNDPQNPNRGNPSAKGKGGGRCRGGRQRRAFQLKFGFWPCASGTGGVVDRAVGSGHRAVRKHRRVRWRGGGILYAAPMTWHQMGFKGPGLSCRLALGGYNFINMNNTAGQ